MLEKVKLLLGSQEDQDDTFDARLNLIISMTKQRLKLLLGGLDPPESMEHIIIDVSIIRFNRIGSEGLSGHTVEGESLSFGEYDFDCYQDEIQAFLEMQDESLRGKVRFI